MAYIDFVGKVHNQSKRDYKQRVLNFEKAACAEVAKKWDYDYWDGDRCYGYGGYTYDGRWRVVAEHMVRHYGLKDGDRILDIGCGKGYLLYELSQILPGAVISGIDISKYAICNAKKEIKPFLKLHSSTDLPYPDNSQDFIVSITTLHNLQNFELFNSLKEIQRVGKGKSFITLGSYTNKENADLFRNWTLLGATILHEKEWVEVLKHSEYSGDFNEVPDPRNLDDIWFYMNMRMNFSRLFRKQRKTKLEQQLKSLKYVSNQTAPDNALIIYFYAFLQEKVNGEIDENVKNKLYQRLSQSEYWRERFRCFGMSYEQVRDRAFPDRIEHGGIPKTFISDPKVFDFPTEVITS